MGVNTKIEWCDFTFNCWRGCQKVAPGCYNCYAEAQSKRNPGTLGIWGPNGTRVVASEAMWREPVNWNRKAEQLRGEFAELRAERNSLMFAGKPPRPRVFCASLADVFEDWDGQCKMSDGRWANNCYTSGILDRFTGVSLAKGKSATTLNDVRARLFKLIDATPHLDWLLLTKRPENVRQMWPSADCVVYHDGDELRTVGIDGVDRRGALRAHRSNVWLGTSIACQDDADRNIPLLLQCRDLSPVLFLSIEPLVGPVMLHHWIDESGMFHHSQGVDVDWVIVGGESGPNARPCRVEWIRDIVRQCQEVGVPCFVKQLGSNVIHSEQEAASVAGMWDASQQHFRPLLTDPKGGDPSEWPEDLRVREVPCDHRSR